MAKMDQIDLFVSGEGGYHTYRIPSLLTTARGVVLALCEGRKDSSHDSGQIDLMVRRSTDGGLTWDGPRVIATEPAVTCGNPCPVLDRTNGTIWLPFCKNDAEGPERMIIAGEAPRTVWMTKSADDGATWAEPWEITSHVKPSGWTWYATGPCHGIQLRSGRLLVPCDHVESQRFDRSDPMYAHVIYSDDHGASWRTGGRVGPGGNECAVAECADGSVYLNARNYLEPHNRRLCARSTNGGLAFGAAWHDATLVEPVCQAGLEHFPFLPREARSRLLFSNPASLRRENLTVRISYDEGATWYGNKSLNGGPSAYSDLAVAPDYHLLCLYEGGVESAYERITLARFDLEWLTDGQDRTP